jgi:PadR family transcriptional regulator, regulatory protein PadR
LASRSSDVFLDFRHLLYIMEDMRRELPNQLELVLMLALIRLGQDAYGVRIAREILERTGREIPVASIYAGLTRLEKKGFVASRLGEPTPERGGRAKIFFRITSKGVRVTRDAHFALKQLSNGIPQLEGAKA